MRLRTFAARLALAVALLASGQAALEHPIAHVDELGGFVHLYGGHSHDEDSGPLCDAFAALTACAAQSALAFSEGFSGYRAPESPACAPRPAEAPPFLSQGPPRFGLSA
jgi:hypothetical protein